MRKLNCWEVKKCGQDDAARFGKKICPARTESRLDGVHGGFRGGRACWVVAGTFCGGVPQGNFAAKYRDCEKCNFYRQVQEEEGPSYQLSAILLKRLRDGGEAAGV